MTLDEIDRLCRVMHEAARQYRDAIPADLGPRLLLDWGEVPASAREEYRHVVRAVLAALGDRLCDEPLTVEARP